MLKILSLQSLLIMYGQSCRYNWLEGEEWKKSIYNLNIICKKNKIFIIVNGSLDFDRILKIIKNKW